MRTTGRHYGTGRKPVQLLLGWMLAVSIVGMAVFGPSLTGRRNPALLGIRHAILMIDREFERWPTRDAINGAATMIFAEVS